MGGGADDGRGGLDADRDLAAVCPLFWEPPIVLDNSRYQA